MLFVGVERLEELGLLCSSTFVSVVNNPIHITMGTICKPSILNSTRLVFGDNSKWATKLVRRSWLLVVLSEDSVCSNTNCELLRQMRNCLPWYSVNYILHLSLCFINSYCSLTTNCDFEFA